MTIPRSPAVAAALMLVRAGSTAYAAAKATGCTSGAIYKSAEYKAMKAKKAKRAK